METNNKWMQDPELKNIDRAKLDFLDKMFVQSASVNRGNQKEMMSFLLSLGKLRFSVLKKYSTPDDIAKMQKISSFFRSR